MVGGRVLDMIQTKQQCVAREQRKRTATGTTPSNQTRRQAGDFFQQLPGVLVNTGFAFFVWGD